MVGRSKAIILLTLIALSSSLLLANFEYRDAYLEKILYTCVALTIIYFFFEVLFEEYAAKKVKDSKTRYSLRKIISILTLVVFSVVFVSIWIVETQNVLIAIGLIGAAIAFAIQDIFKNFIGGLMIFLNGIYRVGDRIEINERFGDVIDISVFYTTLMETREWVSGDQVTGRLTIVPNGLVLNSAVENYTRDFNFIWDEITIPITYDSDWKEGTTKILDIVTKETGDVTENAKKMIERIEGKYYFAKKSLEPAIFLTLTDNWITFGIRYVTEVRQRRVIHDRLSRIILSEIEKSEKIKIASATMNITGFPPIRLKTEKDQ
jgi:small-conductance mechanosensitive channel